MHSLAIPYAAALSDGPALYPFRFVRYHDQCASNHLCEDVWLDERTITLVEENFIFWQRNENTEEARLVSAAEVSELCRTEARRLAGSWATQSLFIYMYKTLS